MRPVALAVLLGLALSSLPAEAASTRHCTSVDSRAGWVTVSPPDGHIQNAKAEGEWTVDARNYKPVTFTGHWGDDLEKLAPYNAYKYAADEKFGALIVELQDGRVMSFDLLEQHIRQGWYYGNPLVAGSFRARINDSDNTLQDNQGAIDICLTVLDDFKPKDS